jgi:hypothetical protein
VAGVDSGAKHPGEPPNPMERAIRAARKSDEQASAKNRHDVLVPPQTDMLRR